MEGLLLFWQLPQTLAALAVIRILNAKKYAYYRGKKYYVFASRSWVSGASLGEYILLREDNMDKTIMDHEYGHSVQSRIFGPLYLLAVGIPSAVFNNLWDRLFHKKWAHEKRHRWYYSRYPEAWANRLGGVAA